ncbi:LppP/LprE family lipoprotein [Rhodococcus sp. D2-41]|uniref:LppP/LprE family lipoprotein n=1 Tax=Speluncibacter jeojiensis TaxID=2710754 RepID=UPI00240FB74A|nr:LppP/LprE family lipoprotein [Rhodococcus sp. D2-41]MDG3012281.1 LppP/LprE family lipoprotein [Rhodococcus sp. D2-41]
MRARAVFIVAGIAVMASACAGNGPPLSRGYADYTSASHTFPAQTTEATAAAAQPPNGSGHGLCFDANSAFARDAVATLGPAPAGGPWQVGKADDTPLSAGCPDLSWMQVDDSATNDGTFASAVLFFHDGEYVGTATPQPYSYTDVIGSDARSVAVRYRWIIDDDPLCCPRGGPSVVTFTWDGVHVQAHGTFPPSS